MNKNDDQVGLPTEEMFKLLVEGVKDYGIFMLDLNGYIQGWNQGAERIKGYKSQEIIGKHFSIFYTDEDRARNHPQNELKIALREGKYEEEGWRVKKDGSRFWANIVITKIENNGKAIGFGKVTRDLTERKMAEDKLKSAYENLEKRIQERTQTLTETNEKLVLEIKERFRIENELQKAVGVRDEFLSIASHELRTPVTALKLQVQSLIRHIKNKTISTLSPERYEKMALSFDASLSRLVKLIDNLLDVSRINSGKIQLHPEPIKLKEVINTVYERIIPEATEAGSKIKIFSEDSLNGFYDRLRLEQILTNLCINAIKYGAGKPIEVSVYKEANELIIKIKDHGIGISETDLEKTFNRFERVGEHVQSTEGLGLGLYILKQIVNAHQGHIEVQSKLGEGTTFLVRLPYHNSEQM